MLTAPTYWDEIAAMPDARIKCRLRYYPDGTHAAYFTDDDLSSNGVSLEGGISDGGSIVGNLVSRRISFTIKDYAPNEALIQCYTGNKDSNSFTNGSRFELFLWMHSDIGVVINGARWRDSGYLSFAVMPFYVTEKIISGNDLTIVAYDYFKLLEMQQAVQPASTGTGDITIDNLANYIGGITGIKDAILTDYNYSLNYVSVPIQSVKEQNWSKADLLRMFCRLYSTNLVIDLNQSTGNKVKAIIAYDDVRFQLPSSSTYYNATSRELITSGYYAKYPIGQLTTCESLTIEQPTILQNAVFVRGSEYQTTPMPYGNQLPIEIPDFFPETTSNNVWAMSAHLMRYYYNLYCYNVEATGAVFNPLYEPGDVLSVPLGNGLYKHFVPLLTRMSINGLCYGSAFAGIKNDAVWNNTLLYSSTAYHEQNIRPNQQVSVAFRGTHVFSINRILLNVVAGYGVRYPTTAKIANVTLSSITVVYVDVNNVSHTITFDGVLANGNNAYYPINSISKVRYVDGPQPGGIYLCIQDVVFYSTQELPTADQVKSITSCDLVLKNSGDSGDGQVITIYVNNTA